MNYQENAKLKTSSSLKSTDFDQYSDSNWIEFFQGLEKQNASEKSTNIYMLKNFIDRHLQIIDTNFQTIEF